MTDADVINCVQRIKFLVLEARAEDRDKPLPSSIATAILEKIDDPKTREKLFKDEELKELLERLRKRQRLPPPNPEPYATPGAILEHYLDLLKMQCKEDRDSPPPLDFLKVTRQRAMEIYKASGEETVWKTEITNYAPPIVEESASSDATSTATTITQTHQSPLL